MFRGPFFKLLLVDPATEAIKACENWRDSPKACLIALLGFIE
jgi:hypothetical protein